MACKDFLGRQECSTLDEDFVDPFGKILITKPVEISLNRIISLQSIQYVHFAK